MKNGTASGSIALTKRTLLQTGAAAVLSAPFVNRAWADTVELNMLGWYGTAEPDMVGAFEEENNVKFVPKYYAGGDNMLAALAQNPPGTFDIIHTDAEYAKLLIANELVEELNPDDYPMDDLLHEDFTKFSGHWDEDGKLFSLISRFGHLGVSYNKDAMSEKEASTYEAFWMPKVEGKVGHFDWHLPSLGQMSLLEGNANPFDIDDDAWEKVQARTMSLKPQVGGYFDFGGTLKKDMALKYLAYTMSPEGQVKTAQMLGYPGHCVTAAGRALLQKEDEAEAKRSGQVKGHKNEPIGLIDEGRIHYRDIPVQQDLEDHCCS